MNISSPNKIFDENTAFTMANYIIDSSYEDNAISLYKHRFYRPVTTSPCKYSAYISEASQARNLQLTLELLFFSEFFLNCIICNWKRKVKSL